MFIPDREKDGRKEALKKLMDLMGKGAADSLSEYKSKKFGKPEVDIEMKIGPEEEEDEGMEDSLKGGAPSEQDIEKIKELYHKYCM